MSVSASFSAASSQYATFAGALAVTAPPFTLAGWFRPTLVDASRHDIFGFYDSSSNARLSLLVSETDKLRLDAHDGSALTQTTVSTLLTANNWYHAAAVVAAVDDRKAILNGSTSNSSSVSRNVTWDRLVCGRKENSGISQYFDGQLTHWGLWDVALTDDEIALLANARVHPLSIRPGSLVSLFDHAGLFSGGNIVDRMSAGQNLTAGGSPTSSNEQPARLRAFPGRTPQVGLGTTSSIPSTKARISVGDAWAASVSAATPNRPFIAALQINKADKTVTLTLDNGTEATASYSGAWNDQAGALIAGAGLDTGSIIDASTDPLRLGEIAFSSEDMDADDVDALIRAIALDHFTPSIAIDTLALSPGGNSDVDVTSNVTSKGQDWSVSDAEVVDGDIEVTIVDGTTINIQAVEAGAGEDQDPEGETDPGDPTIAQSGTVRYTVTLAAPFDYVSATGDVTVTISAGAFANGYTKRRGFQIEALAGGSTSIEGFVEKLRFSHADLADTGNGGFVTSSSGNDIRLELEDATNIPINIDDYDNTTGDVLIDALIPTRDTSAPLRGFIYYGKSGAAAESDPDTVFADYWAVWQLPTLTDLSPNGRDLTSNGTVASSSDGNGGSTDLAGAGTLSLASITGLSGLSGLTVETRIHADASGTDEGWIAVTPLGTDADSPLGIRYDSVGFGSGVPANVIHTKVATAAGNVGSASEAGSQTDDWQDVAITYQNIDTLIGVYVDGKSSPLSYTNDGATGSQTLIEGDLYIGTGARGSALGDWNGLIDEVRIRPAHTSDQWQALRARSWNNPAKHLTLGDEEVATDTDRSPVAASISTSTTVGQTLNIDVGAAAYNPSSLTLALSSVSAAALGAASDAGGATIDYIAGSSPGSETFEYVLTASGKSSTGKIHIEVADTDQPVPVNTVFVSNYAEFSSAFAGASPGTKIVCNSGTYTGAQFIINRQGTAANPIQIVSNVLLGAKFPGGFNFSTGSANIILSGLDLTNARNIFAGTDNRITRCKIKPPALKTSSSLAFGVRGGSGCRIDHCDLSLGSMTGWTEGRVYGLIRGQGSGTNLSTHQIGLRIDHNWFHDWDEQDKYQKPYTYPINSAQNFTESEAETKWIVENNLFENCNTGSIIAEFKSSSNICRYNHFKNSNGYFSIRQGHENEFYGNTMENCKAVYVFRGPDHSIRGNKLTGGASYRVMSGKVAKDVFSTKPPASFDNYFGGNEGPIIVGENFGDPNFSVKPEKTVIEAHKGLITYVNGATATVRSAVSSGITIESPITLTQAQVGPSAP